MMAFLLDLFLLHLVFEISVNGYPHYADRLPNGRNVSNHCSSHSKWIGVGHINEAGGGSKNPFGIAFASAGHLWTPSLCQADSDGDGKTNGEELGDPNCVWTAGTIPARTYDISHPGVCEPVNSVLCKSKNQQIFGTTFCANHAFDCPALNASDVTPMDFRITNTSVSAKETSFICQAFAVGLNTTQHLIGMTPLIDNANIMHHISVFGCLTKPGNDLLLHPQSCQMMRGGCPDHLTVWVLGVKGDCFNDQLGISMGGSKGYSYIYLELHWNNPQQLSTYFDSSGVRLYMTTSMRSNEGALIMAGRRYLEIPPGRESVFQNMTCSSGCTKRLLTERHQVHITSSYLHMHSKGRYGSVEQWRNGHKVMDLIPYQEIHYENPLILRHAPAQILEAGDEIRISCNYNSIGNTRTLYWGSSTQDEMCHAYIRYYPKLPHHKIFQCLTYGDADLCLNVDNIGSCNLTSFRKAIFTNVLAEVLAVCDLALDICKPLCKNYTHSLLQHPCMTGWPRRYLDFLSTSEDYFATTFSRIRLAIARCEAELSCASQVPMNSITNTVTVTTATYGRSIAEASLPLNQMALLLVGVVASFALVLVMASYGFVPGMWLKNSNGRKKYWKKKCVSQSY